MNTLDAYEELRKNCILSPYAQNHKGYCSVIVAGKSQRHHRLAYAAFYGLSIDDLKDTVIMHKCDVRNCINPLHLVAGTGQDNVDDRVAKGRSAKGQSNGAAKLSVQDVIYIRAANDKTLQQLASMFNVTKVTVSSIKLRKIWKHI